MCAVTGATVWANVRNVPLSPTGSGATFGLLTAGGSQPVTSILCCGFGASYSSPSLPYVYAIVESLYGAQLRVSIGLKADNKMTLHAET